MREFAGYKKGVDLGGWLSQCGEGNYTDERFSTFITEADIEKIASWGLDHVRLPVDYNVIQNEDGSFRESGFAYIDKCIEWCRKYGLKMVLDLHKTLGFIFDDKDYCHFFAEEELQDIFVKLWEEFTRRYGQYHDFVAFELLNEVTNREFAEPWNKISARAVKAIRAMNKDVKIIIGGIFNDSIYGLTLLEKPADENIVFTFHCYSPILFTHQAAYWVDDMPSDFSIEYPGKLADYRDKSREFFGDRFDIEFDYNGDMMDSRYFEKVFKDAVAVAEKYNVPLYCGEYGVIDRAAPESTVNWFRDINTAFEKLDIARAVWTYKDKDFGLTDEHYASVLPELVKLL